MTSGRFSVTTVMRPGVSRQRICRSCVLPCFSRLCSVSASLKAARPAFSVSARRNLNTAPLFRKNQMAALLFGLLRREFPIKPERCRRAIWSRRARRLRHGGIRSALRPTSTTPSTPRIIGALTCPCSDPKAWPAGGADAVAEHHAAFVAAVIRVRWRCAHPDVNGRSRVRSFR